MVKIYFLKYSKAVKWLDLGKKCEFCPKSFNSLPIKLKKMIYLLTNNSPEMSPNINGLLVFVVENQRFAIELSSVERVIRAVAVTKLIDAPGFIEGIIDYYGEVIAVINLRKPFGYPLHELSLGDRFIIVRTTVRKLALIVDDVEHLVTPESGNWFASKDINKGLKFLNILRDDEGIILIYDLESVLDIEEEIKLCEFFETNFSSDLRR